MEESSVWERSEKEEASPSIAWGEQLLAAVQQAQAPQIVTKEESVNVSSTNEKAKNELPELFPNTAKLISNFFGGGGLAKSHNEIREKALSDTEDETESRLDDSEEDEDVTKKSIRELRQRIKDAGLSDLGCVERKDLESRALEAVSIIKKRQKTTDRLEEAVERKIGGLKCYILGATMPELIVIIYHGYLAPASELLPLANAIAKRTFEMGVPTRLILPQSPGHAWFSLQFSSYVLAVVQGEREKARVIRETPKGVPELRRHMRSFLQEILELHPNLSKKNICLCGFSQGAMVALDIALDSEEQMAGVVLISSFLMSIETWAQRLCTIHNGLRCLQLHGLQDSIVPFYTASWLCELLKNNGAKTIFIPHSGGHEMGPPHVFASLLSFLTSLTPGSAATPY